MTLRDKAGRFGKSLKRRVVEFSQRAFLAFVFIGMTTAMFQIFVFKTAPEVKVITKEVQAAKVEVKRETPLVLSKICGCESLGDRNSKGAQFDKNGKLIKLVNADKTVDIGACGINEYHWEAKAAKLGFNIYEEAGNRAMAEWIFENHGTWPWNPSISCWNR